MTHATAFRSQTHFRFRSDTDTADATPTWIAGEDTNISVDCSSGNVTLRLRVCIQETGGADVSTNPKLRYSVDGYTTDLTTTSSKVKMADASTSADDTALTVSRLSGSNSFVNGYYDETGGTATAINLTANNYTEMEWGLTVVAADCSDGDVIDFKGWTGGGTLDSYTVTPRITVRKTSGAGTLRTSSTANTAAAGNGVLKEKVAVTAGDLIVAVFTGIGGGTFSSFSDSDSNSWTTLDSDSTSGWGYAIAANTTELTVTATRSGGSASALCVNVFEGSFTASPLDQNPAWTTGDNANPRSSPSSGTLAQADELVLGGFSQGTSTAVITKTSGSPFTLCNT